MSSELMEFVAADDRGNSIFISAVFRCDTADVYEAIKRGLK